MSLLSLVVSERKVQQHARRFATGLEWCGIHLDAVKNEQATGETDLSADDSRTKILIVSTNEELIVSRETARVLKAHG